MNNDVNFQLKSGSAIILGHPLENLPCQTFLMLLIHTWWIQVIIDGNDIATINKKY